MFKARKPPTPPSGRVVEQDPRELARDDGVRDIAHGDGRQSDDMDTGPDAECSYPLFPHLDAADLDLIAVYRRIPQPDGKRGNGWRRIAFPFDASMTTWDTIAKTCGGGMFTIQAKLRGRVVASCSRTLEGVPRSPDANDLATVAPGLNDHGRVTETAGGWVAIPGIEGGAQAAFIAYQQVAWYARDDAHKMVQALSIMMEKISEKAMQPDPGLAVLQSLVEAQRQTIERLYSEQADTRKKITALQVDAASQGDEEKKIKVAAYQKAIDIADNVAGVVAAKLLNAPTGNSGGAAGGTMSGAANVLGDAIAKRLGGKA